MRKVVVIGGHDACRKAIEAMSGLGKSIDVICVNDSEPAKLPTSTVGSILKMNVGKYEFAPKKAGKKPKGWERPYKFHK